MSYLTIFFDQMSYLAKCRIDQKSYATNCRIGEMVFDELSCTPLTKGHSGSKFIIFGDIITKVNWDEVWLTLFEFPLIGL